MTNVSRVVAPGEIAAVELGDIAAELSGDVLTVDQECQAPCPDGTGQFRARSPAVTGLRHHENAIVVHGACETGADAMADRICRVRGIPADPHPADWDAPCRPECKPGHRCKRGDGSTYCPAAGHYRNQEMVNLGAHVCVAAFQPGESNAGTSDCVRHAVAAWIPVRPIGDVPASIKRLLGKQAAALPGF